MVIRQFNSEDSEFRSQLDALLAQSVEPSPHLIATVQAIINDVRQRGDTALLEYTNRFDRRNAGIADLEIPAKTLKASLDSIAAPVRNALEQAVERIHVYHENQKQESWRYIDNQGNTLGQQVTPVDRAGVYVPGGKAAYPSSVLMNVIPAKVAGVSEIIMVVPCPAGEENPLVLAAAAIAGVDRVFSVGGAQAVAALAYGTETIPAVDKIVGPGNSYVATAKRLVFGAVGIDMIAGPSEVLIVADESANPDWLAMDLFAQAEHDEDASAILASPDEKVLESVKSSIEKLLGDMERADIIRVSLENHGALVKTRNLDECIELVNYIAPEHLELAVNDPEKLLPVIRNAGAIFLGRYSAEVLGDYCAGPNHVLPTSRTARFSSPLGVYDFQKRSSIILCHEQSVQDLAETASVLARGEGLTAHARSAEFRIKS
ncbi:MAG TPA: histidinol dehydrogenase [Gammaproteobacteria bacterium]|nr:histidinol dehydrogenase [Gammaproteobacteria bacterium]